MKVTYPKYKFGEELVWEVACAPTYGKLYFSSDLMKMPNGHKNKIPDRHMSNFSCANPNANELKQNL